MTELAQVRLLVLAIVVAILAAWAGSIASRRRQEARFAALAASFGSQVVREGKFLSRFPVEIDGRSLEVRYQHIGKAVGAISPSIRSTSKRPG